MKCGKTIQKCRYTSKISWVKTFMNFMADVYPTKFCAKDRESVQVGVVIQEGFIHEISTLTNLQMFSPAKVTSYICGVG